MVPIIHYRYTALRHWLLGIAGGAGVLAIGGLQPFPVAIALCLVAAAGASAFVLARQWQAVLPSIKQRAQGHRDVDGLALWRMRARTGWSAEIELVRKHMEEQVTLLTMDFAELITSSAIHSGASNGMAFSVHEAMKLRGELMLRLSEFIKELRKMSEDVGVIADEANLRALHAAIEAAQGGVQGRAAQALAEATHSADITDF